jgi:hypothetical protein
MRVLLKKWKNENKKMTKNDNFFVDCHCCHIKGVVNIPLPFIESKFVAARHRVAQHVVRSIILRFVLTRISKY